jgi:hypothetical protein
VIPSVSAAEPTRDGKGRKAWWVTVGVALPGGLLTNTGRRRFEAHVLVQAQAARRGTTTSRPAS